jgi:hypothetical protein
LLFQSIIVNGGGLRGNNYEGSVKMVGKLKHGLQQNAFNLKMLGMAKYNR